MGQHWFGNFVQGRDWANIWLNEGFATYFSALYTWHHEGNDAFRLEIYDDQTAEQAQDRNDYRRPIVDRHYTDPLQMFDAITHEKGAVVLDMMRYVLDGADTSAHPPSQNTLFFRALRYYLTRHHAQTADTADLLDAIWTTTGQDLTWFFHEWVFMAGHPDYRVEASYDAAKRIEKLKVAQTQQVDAVTPIFDMPIDLAFYGVNGERKEIRVRDNSPQQQFDIPLDFEPQWVDFDPDDLIDKTVDFKKSEDALIAESERDPSMMSRLWASEQLGAKTRTDSVVATLKHVLANDSFYGVRAVAATSLGSVGTVEAKSALLSALQQPDSRVRTAVVHSGAFEVLQAEAATKPEVHVMQASLDGLVSTKDARSAAILLAQAQAGVPERVRLSALRGLEGLKDSIARDHPQDLVEVVRAALNDRFLAVRETGVELVGIFGLAQFQQDIQTEAQNAPIAQERDAAQQVLEQLNRLQ